MAAAPKPQSVPARDRLLADRLLAALLPKRRMIIKKERVSRFATLEQRCIEEGKPAVQSPPE